MKIEKIKMPKRVEESLFNLFVENYDIYALNNSKKVAVHHTTKKWCYIQKHSICPMLRNMYFETQNQTLSNSSVNVVYELICSIADNCQDTIMSVNGIEQTTDTIIYDIRGSDKYVEIKANEIRMKSKKKSRIVFMNESNTQPIFPNMNGSDSKYLDIIELLFGKNPNNLIFAVYLALLFVRNINHPMLIITGEYGAAKTTFSRMVSRIVNPQCGDVSPMPKALDDVATVIFNNYYTAFDNLSYISRELADLLCLATTGGNYQKRKLYTDDDVSSMYLHNAISINGLNLSFPYSDLMDRAIVIELSRISSKERLSEEQVWNRFYKYLPELLGCIFILLSKAMAKYKNVKLENTPRLADFALWGYAVAESIEVGLGKEFIQQYERNISSSLVSAAESNPLLSAISNLMIDKDNWEGTPTQLLRKLETVYYKTTIATQLPRSFPTTANVLSRKLNILQNDLAVMGMHLTIGRESKRYIRITKNQED